MKLVLAIFVVVSCVMMHEVMGRCQGWGDECSMFDTQSNCCNGFTCKHWNLLEGRCKRNEDNSCVKRGEKCGLFKWCCGDLDCDKNMWGNYVCKRD